MSLEYQELYIKDFEQQAINIIEQIMEENGWWNINSEVVFQQDSFYCVGGGNIEPGYTFDLWIDARFVENIVEEAFEDMGIELKIVDSLNDEQNYEEPIIPINAVKNEIRNLIAKELQEFAEDDYNFSVNVGFRSGLDFELEPYTLEKILESAEVLEEQRKAILDSL